MSYQPSHLEYADWSEPLGYLFTRLYTPQNVISFSTLVSYLPARMKIGLTKYDRVILEVRKRVTTRGFQSGSGVWPVGRIRDSIKDILGYSDAIKIPFGEWISSGHNPVIDSNSQTDIPSWSHFIAKTPPPWASKVGPYDARLHSVTPHPGKVPLPSQLRYDWLFCC